MVKRNSLLSFCDLESIIYSFSYGDIDEAHIYYTYDKEGYQILIDIFEMESWDYMDLYSMDGEYTLTDTEINGYDAIIFEDSFGVEVDLFDTDHRVVISVNTNGCLEDALEIVRTITIE